MIIILEIDDLFNAKPGKYESNIMKRYWWLWFAITILKIPLKEYSSNKYKWEYPNKEEVDDERKRGI